jgi:3-phenylpropionate/trans-cinnamate dioxygenase ferredoxin reductase subunit
MAVTFVIVGANLAGGMAAAVLRKEGFDGRLVLIGTEPHPPYERPPLSKEYLRGEQSFEEGLVRPAGWYAEADIETRFGTEVERIDPRDKAVVLAGGERIRCDGLLLATGGRPRRLLGEPTERILYLRSVEDADRLRSHLVAGRHLLIIGGGFIGAEVAASARRLGVEVTITARGPLLRALGREVGQLYSEIHRDEGVKLRTGEGVESIKETGGSVVVHTSSGAALEGDAVVIGVGMQPNVELAEAAGVGVANGILVDEFCRSDVEGIYAAGDVANHYHPVFGRRIRVEHYDNALKQGAAAARNMLGKAEVFDDPHWFWSNQYDYNLQYAGFADEWDELVVRGSLKARNFIAFYLKGGVILAALGINRGRDVRRAMKVIQAKAAPDPALLGDEEIDLRTFVPVT